MRQEQPSQDALLLRHTFTVSSYSRKTTPGVQVRIDYEGFTGYREASMPPYLGQTVESVCAFLSRGMEVIDGHIVLPDRPGIGILPL